MSVWNKGLAKNTDIRVKNTGLRVSESLKGRKLSDLHKIRIGIGNKGKNKGKKYSIEHKLKIGLASKNRKYPIEKYPNHGMRNKKQSNEAKHQISEFNKNKFVSLETRKKISLIHKGKNLSDKTKKLIGLASKGRISPLKGKTLSPETILKIKAKRKLQIISKETCKKISLSNTGKKRTTETKEKLKAIRMQLVMPLKDTRIEVKLQNILKSYFVQFEKHKPLIGQPDIFIEPNICIFVDGCFWHGCEQHGGERNKYNLERKRRDEYVNRKLNEQGYKVLRFWEHTINNDLISCYEKIRLEMGK